MDDTFDELFIRLQSLSERERFLFSSGIRERLIEEIDFHPIDDEDTPTTDPKQEIVSRRAKKKKGE